jgi:outer membrane protein assembly factor BamB
MRSATGVLVGGVLLLCVNGLCARDWPQWRGPNRDAKATDFQAPKSWPKELTQKWKVTVGEGVATPALVGDRLYVFGRQDGEEVVRCLEAATGKELWQDKYKTGGATGPAAGFSGPRSSPAVADGKVVTLGVRGVLSCYDAATGKKLWRKEESTVPRFSVSSSPMIVDGLCIAQLGGENNGSIVAFDLTSGDQKWKWTDDGTAYSSAVLLNLGGTRAVVAETKGNIVAIGVADGKLLWKTPFAVRYNACTPMVDGQTVLYSGAGKGTKAVKIAKEGDNVTAKKLWSNENGVQFNTPVVTNGLVFGLSDNSNLFCINAETGKTNWTAPVGAPAGGGGRRGGGRGYGSIVDAGSVLLALTPAGQLMVIEPSSKEFKQLASYKVAEKDTYAYPVVVGKRIYVKDRDSLILWTIE